MLREVVLGPERFDPAFREYIRRWAFKHPTPQDFYRTIENIAGEDLGWFWKGWFEENWLLDQAVETVSYVNQNPAQGSLITLRNLDRLAMPVPLAVTEENGTTTRIQLPVEIWQRGDAWTTRLPTTPPLTQVIVDPDKMLPDANPANNQWQPLTLDSDTEESNQRTAN